MVAPQLTSYQSGVNSVSGDQLNTFIQACDTIAQLRAFTGVAGQKVYVAGLAAPGDGGGGVFFWVVAGTAADDGITVIVPNGATGLWLRNYETGVLPSLLISSGTTINLTTAPFFVYVNKTVSSPTTLILPTALSPLTAPPPNNAFVIIDAKGDAAANNITISAAPNTIGGVASKVISTNFGNLKVVWGPTQWLVW